MGSERTEAINNMINDRDRRTSFYYVDISKAERLGITQYKTNTGTNFIRIMPPPDPKGSWAKKVYIHRDIGSDNATFICLKETFGEPCPVCELREKMMEEGDDERIIKAMNPVKRYLIFVYDVMDDSTIAKGLRWYDSPSMIIDNIAGLSRDKRTRKIIDVCDPKDGRDVGFNRKGFGKRTEYDSFELSISDPVPVDWYSDIPEFNDVLSIPSYDQVADELSGGVGRDDDDVSGSNSPLERPRGRRRMAESTNHFDANDGVGNSKVEEEEEGEVSVETEVGESRRTGHRSRSSSMENERQAPQNSNVSNIKKKLEEIRNRRSQAD